MSKRIPLTKGYYTVVNNADYDLVWNFQWYVSVNGKKAYAGTSVKGNHISMHRFLLDVYDERIVDHANNDGLDNRRENLRVCTDSQNKMNRSFFKSSHGYKGVGFYPKTGKYTASIFNYYKKIQVGSFDTAIEAALAYDDAAREHYGEFAYLNFPSKNDRRAPLEEMDDNKNFVRLINGDYILIEPEDWDYLSRFRWRHQKAWGEKWYASRGGGKRGLQFYMHRDIMEHRLGRKLLTTEIVDHINHDTLDHRFSNLRIVNATQSSVNQPKKKNNTSGFIGVSWSKAAKKWMAKIKKDKKQTYIGLFNDKENAARARDKAVVENYGIEYANLNFPEEWDG